MAGQNAPNQKYLEGLYQALRNRAAGLAPKFKPGVDSTELDSDDLETVWNRRAMSLEDEWNLWRQVGEDGVTPFYTREQIGLMVYPDRERLAKSGGRVEPKEMIAWTNQTAKRMAAKREQRAAEQAAMSPIPPDGRY